MDRNVEKQHAKTSQEMVEEYSIQPPASRFRKISMFNEMGCLTYHLLLAAREDIIHEQRKKGRHFPIIRFIECYEFYQYTHARSRTNNYYQLYGDLTTRLDSRVRVTYSIISLCMSQSVVR